MTNINGKVAYTGVLNPNLRVFDVIMRTEFGTSYNAYAVFGDEKTALIETAHLSFCDSYLRNVSEALRGKKADYLVLNHCEPDHTGCVARLLEVYPDITVIVSQAGAIYIKGITNRDDIKLLVVKDGDSIELGGVTLNFLNSPFLHWPDSMFTWVPEVRTLFTCDFLGCHYCEPQIFDINVTYPSLFDSAFKYYYDCIFKPFSPFVRKGLDKIRGIIDDVDYICASHGPVLTRDGFIDEAIERYSLWSADVVKINRMIPIFYCSAYGNTRLLADGIKNGILSVHPGADVPVYDIIENDMALMCSVLNACDGFLIGSPTINKDAVPPVWHLLSDIDCVNIQKRPAALFGSYGWSGEALPHLAERLLSLKVKVFEKQLKVCFVPSKQDIVDAERFGAEFAESF